LNSKVFIAIYIIFFLEVEKKLNKDRKPFNYL